MGKRGKVIIPKSFSRNRGVASDDMDDACKQAHSLFLHFFFQFFVSLLKKDLNLEMEFENLYSLFCVADSMIHLFFVLVLFLIEKEKEKS